MPDPISPKYVDVQDESSDGSVLLEATREGVAIVLLNRAHKRNALDGRMVAALTEAFQTLQGAEGVRLVLLRGAGSSFCAGADLAWHAHVAGLPEEDNWLDAIATAEMLKALYDIPALTAALVDGAASGAGAGLVAACDMAVATTGAVFAFPEVRLGLTSGVLSPYVIEATGARTARRLFATGRRIDAEEALRIGLVDQLAADAEALNQVQDELAADVLACAPGAIGEIKRLVKAQAGQVIGRPLIEDSARRLARARVSPEGQEGIAAFLDRRPPAWRG